MKNKLIILTVLFLAFPAGAEAGDLEDIVAAIEKRWTDTAKKNRLAPETLIQPEAGWQLPKGDCGNFRLPQRL